MTTATDRPPAGATDSEDWTMSEPMHDEDLEDEFNSDPLVDPPPTPHCYAVLRAVRRSGAPLREAIASVCAELTGADVGAIVCQQVERWLTHDEDDEVE
jgi:hypothetical protein